MQELIKILIGVAFLVLGWLVGNLLAKVTKEELRWGRKYFIILIWVGLVLGAYGLVISNDVLLFSGFFIAIVTSRSLKK